MLDNEDNNQPITFEWDSPTDITASQEPETPTEDAVEPNPQDDPSEPGDAGSEEGDGVAEPEAEEGGGEPEGLPEGSTTDPTRVILEDLVSLGMAGEDEIKDITAENFYPFLQGLIEKKIDSALNESLDGLQEREKAALEFILNGGSLDELAEKYSVPKFNVAEDKGALDFLRYYHKQEGLTDEEVDEKIDFYESRDNAQHYAKKYHDKWKEAQQTEKVKQLKAPKEDAERQRQKREQWRTTILTDAKKVDEYAGYKFEADRKKALINDLTINNVKTQDGQYTSQFINNFFKVYNGQDPNKLMLIAEILRDDFKPEMIVQKAETKGTQEVKTKLQKLAQNKTPQGSTKQERPLWDNF